MNQFDLSDGFCAVAGSSSHRLIMKTCSQFSCLVAITLCLLSQTTQAQVWQQAHPSSPTYQNCPPGYAQPYSLSPPGSPFCPPGQYRPMPVYPYPEPIYRPEASDPQQPSRETDQDPNTEDEDEDLPERPENDFDRENFQNNMDQMNAQNFNQASNFQTAQGPTTQSTARPNMIGDYREAPFFYTNGFNNVTLPQQGIVRLDFSQNTNPIPTDRFYMNYHHYRNAFSAQAGIIGNDRLFYATLEDNGGGGVADTIRIGSITTSQMGDALTVTGLVGFDVFDPFAYLSTDALVADGFDSANLDIFYFGWEKTFNQERSSFEVRLPVLSAPNQDLNATVDNLQSLNGYQTQLGNMSLLFKQLLLRDYTGRFTVSGGIGVTLPSGPDFRIRDADILIPDQNNVDDATAIANRGFTPPNFIIPPSEFVVAGGPTGRQIRIPGNDITVRNQAVLITPYLAFTQQMGRSVTSQLYFQGDFVASENDLSSPTGEVATIKQQDTLKVDYQLMWWFFRKPDLPYSQDLYLNGVRHQRVEGCHLKGLAGIFELHGTTALIDPDSAGSPELLDDPDYISGTYQYDDFVGTNNNGDAVDLQNDRFFASSNNDRRLRSLNITTGLQADLADGGTLTFAVAVPLVEQAAGVNLFDIETIVQYNFFY